MLRVGRIIFQKNNSIYPSYEGFTNIVVLFKGHTEWGILGPYDLINENGIIMENYWQFSKVYDDVPKIINTKSKHDKTIIWNHPEEIHVKDDKLTSAYYAWRDKGMKSKHAIRYPVGFNHRHNCKYVLAYDQDGTINETNKLDYIQSREKVYVSEYCRLVKMEPKFMELVTKLNNNENLLIIEVDGPHQESLNYYKQKYNVGDDFIVKNTMLVSDDNIRIMLNDTKHPFGHGYCLAMALLEKQAELNIFNMG